MNGEEEPSNAAVVAITSTGRELDSQVDPRFGRCTYFAIIDSSGTLRAVMNTAKDFGNGAGIEAAKQIIDANADVVITGSIGPNAFRVLSAAGVRVFVGGCGTVRDSLERYRSGALSEAFASTMPGRHGRRGNRWGRHV